MNRRNGDEVTAYYTDDPMDAIGTGHHMHDVWVKEGSSVCANPLHKH